MSDTPTRSARARAFIKARGRAVTAREVTDGEFPGDSIRLVSALLGSMVSKGLLVRHKPDKEARFSIGREARTWGNQRPRKSVKPKPARKAKPAPKPKPAKPKPVAAPAPRKIVRGPELTIRDVPRALAKAAPLKPGKYRDVPTGCTLAGIPNASIARSERIAADIAAFKKRGGKIERLGPTQFFKHIKSANEE